MGDRGQVKIDGVYLYTHNGASDLIKDVYNAIKKKLRWDDLEYLARIIFDVMKEGCYNEELGFGIGTSEHLDVWRVIEISNYGNPWIYIRDLALKKINNEYHRNWKQVFEGSFENFLIWYEKKGDD